MADSNFGGKDLLGLVSSLLSVAYIAAPGSDIAKFAIISARALVKALEDLMSGNSNNLNDLKLPSYQEMLEDALAKKQK
jgi:hypothetical protein